MDAQHKYTVEEVLEIILNLDSKDKDLVKEAILNEKDILERISDYHQKYEETYKMLV